MDDITKDVSRRSFLKKVGAGAGLVWAAPTLTSLGSRAFAQSSPACGRPPCGDACVGDDQGPEQFTFCGDNCICVLNGSGGCSCIQLNVGSDQPCQADGECPSGWVCVPNNCLGGTCQPLCSTQTSQTQIPGLNQR